MRASPPAFYSAKNPDSAMAGGGWRGAGGGVGERDNSINNFEDCLSLHSKDSSSSSGHDGDGTGRNRNRQEMYEKMNFLDYT